MSAYNFVPSPDLSTRESSFATWENGFSDSQIQNIIRIGESLEKKKATIGGKNVDDEYSDVRESQVSWIELNNDTMWLYDQLAYIMRQINGQFFDFDICGFVEHFQYTVYESDKKAHYNWHIDKGTINGMAPRKLSLVLQLSDPSEYEGGELQLMIGSEPLSAKKEKGLIYVFPSWVVHRVTPITKGVRRSLVLWAAGPKFK
jgi:PKHD-type hydroxylase